MKLGREDKNQKDILDVTVSGSNEQKKQAGEDGKVHRKLHGIMKEILMYLIVFGIFFGIRYYVAGVYYVDGESMESTLQDKNGLLLDEITYKYGKLERFDVIVFYPEERGLFQEKYIKRIIGMPGETIQIIGSDIYIDGEVLEEDYGLELIEDAGIASEPIVLGEDEYFVMGDNRNNSTDSRSESVGNVNVSQIQGKVILRIWPFSEFGKIDS